MTKFKKGDRVTSTRSDQLPYWGDLTFLEQIGDTYIAVRDDGIRGGFYVGGLALIGADALDVTKTLQTRDGKKARYIGKLDNGQLVFGVTYPGYTGHEATELRYADGRKTSRAGVTSGDDIVVKVVEKVTFLNVYADGTVGTTAHASEEDARQRSKYRKVRVGVLKQTYRNGKLAAAVVSSTGTGWYRSPAFPKGREAKPEDYSRA